MPESLIGKRLPRHDAWAKVRGEQAYSADCLPPNTLFGKTLYSAHAAAVLKKVNTAKAKALPGVHAVLTAEDVPQNVSVSWFGDPARGGARLVAKTLASGRIRSRNEAIALVAAESCEIADAAISLIEVEYEQIETGVFDPREAMLDRYLVGDEETSNVLMRCGVHKGDVEAAWADCAVIVEQDYEVAASEHAYLETECGVAWPAENGAVLMRVGSQVLELYRSVARTVGLPHNKVRNMSVPMGGGFGGKDDITVESALALLVLATGRPVKMAWSRKESIETHAKRHPFYLRYKTGADANGHILAQQADIVINAGAYASTTPLVQMFATEDAAGGYRIPNVDINSTSVLTNTVFNGANRGFGACQVNFAYELQMDALAEKLGMDAVELRLKNCLQPGDAIATGFVPTGSVELERVIRMAAARIPPPDARPRVLPDGRRVGWGLACGMMTYGRLCMLHDTARAALRVELDGSVTLRAGAPDVGCGQISALCQLAAEELGLPMEQVHAYIMDTHLTPLCGNTSSTRQLYMSGHAMLKAVGQVKDAISRCVAARLGCRAAQVIFRGGMVYSSQDADARMTFAEAAQATNYAGGELSAEAQFNAPFTDTPDMRDMKGLIHPDLSYTAHAAQVAVDMETGQFEVLKIIAAIDCGRAINRNSCEGQMEGGAIYNMGYVKEDIACENGVIRANSLATYLIPTAADAPEVETLLYESGGGIGPHGAKGVGEPSCNSIAPAIVSAIHDATGCWMTKLPIRPEALLREIKRRKNR